MHLILDGYNLIYAMPSAGRKILRPLEKAREDLIELTEQAVQKRGEIDSATVVFDGSRDKHSAQSPILSTVEVLFSSEGQTADELIVQTAKQYRKSLRLLVVTSDTVVREQVRILGIESISSRDWLFRIFRDKKSASASSGLCPEDEREITEVYAKRLGIKL